MPTAEPIKNYRLWLAGFFSLTHHYSAYRCRGGNEDRHRAGFSSSAGISGPLPWQNHGNIILCAVQRKRTIGGRAGF